MPNRYGPAMHVFIKVSKVCFSHLQSKGFVLVVLADNSYLQGNSYKACFHTTELLQSLGFTIHPTKSILTPTQRMIFLGFVIDPFQMTLEITEEKKSKIHTLCLEILLKEKITLWTCASVIGKFVASFPAVPFGPFYGNLLKQKILGLKLHNGKFDANIIYIKCRI